MKIIHSFLHFAFYLDVLRLQVSFHGVFFETDEITYLAAKQEISPVVHGLHLDGPFMLLLLLLLLLRRLLGSGVGAAVVLNPGVHSLHMNMHPPLVGARFLANVAHKGHR